MMLRKAQGADPKKKKKCTKPFSFLFVQHRVNQKKEKRKKKKALSKRRNRN